ncbi:MAG: hypothetical protein F6K09_00935 [Merismopedia sp. SIO2A8]|nr:hypothetical protein [Symploca sp. SIO2B6]NET47296.1 hypothetical protein [Merismopedia sp. SIO2A8]
MARAKDGSKSVQVSGLAAELLKENCDQSGLSASEFVKLLILSCSDVLMSRLFPNSSVHVRQTQVLSEHVSPLIPVAETQENPPPINLDF